MTLKWNGDAIQKDILQATVDGCMNTAEQIATKAQILCPRDTGTLSNSITITRDEPNPSEIYSKALTAPVGWNESEFNETTKNIFISANTPYAHYQHELTSAVNYTTPGTTYKYLEKAWNEKIKNITKNIQKVAQSRGLM